MHHLSKILPDSKSMLSMLLLLLAIAPQGHPACQSDTPSTFPAAAKVMLFWRTSPAQGPVIFRPHVCHERSRNERQFFLMRLQAPRGLRRQLSDLGSFLPSIGIHIAAHSGSEYRILLPVSNIWREVRL
ncbi:hypothetical protein L207DRAFT_508195 [Hyaloscypha variabilis F]|uniref:Secreted protein n=1 Tax=Hyaloscypha variabilis (strain UAMH 11265 / GT02V1 / F) TaxID=1149755 RepID=A0A2J6S3E1_HYAVF|nr:hypothetical protein L207DRAFT_508195 [Hyaloscypha variabilis F]